MTSKARMLALTLTSAGAGIQTIPLPAWARILVTGALATIALELAAWRAHRSRPTSPAPAARTHPPLDGSEQKASRA